MIVPTITLSGPGATGVMPAAHLKGVISSLLALPTRVKLGRRPCTDSGGCPRFAAHHRAPSGWVPPAEADYTPKALASLHTMLGNDQYGDCVIAGKGHSVGVWSANDNDSGGEVMPTTREAVDAYHRICGPGDNGCDIREVLTAMTRDGITFGGRVHKLGGWVGVDHTKADEVKAAVHLFGAVTIGFNFPQSWGSVSTWDVTNSPTVGGHDVPIVRYDARGVYVSSWGRLYLMTWKALAQAGRVEECYALLSPDWTGSDKLSPAGVDVAGLEAALAALGQGDMPDPRPAPAPGPGPGPNPVPPPVTWPNFVVTGTTDDYGAFIGRATPDTGPAPAPPAIDPDVATVDFGDAMVAVYAAGMLFPVMGIASQAEGTRLIIHRGKLSPEQWAALIKAIMEAAAAILAIFGAK